ncbi:MAG: cobalamin-binding protein [Woeseiaceae bacterium]
MKVVTLLPSATEIVCALGFEEHLVGVSHSCNFPESIRGVPVMTSTHVPYEKDSVTIDNYVREHLTGHEALYDLDIDGLRTAAPDVVVSQALCDVCAVSTGDVIQAIGSLPSNPALVDLNPNTLDDVLEDILRVGRQLNADTAAKDLVSDLRMRRDVVAKRSATVSRADRPRVAFLEWLLPPFNGGHWNPELVELAGGIDVLGASGRASSTLDWGTIVEQEPDVLFIACCGFRTERALEDVREVSSTDAWRQLPAVQSGRVYIADGNAYFSCPGPRLIDGLEIMAHALHPDVHPPLHGLAQIVSQGGHSRIF